MDNNIQQVCPIIYTEHRGLTFKKGQSKEIRL